MRTFLWTGWFDPPGSASSLLRLRWLGHHLLVKENISRFFLVLAMVSAIFFMVSAMLQTWISILFLHQNPHVAWFHPGFSHEFPAFSLGQTTFMPFCSVLPYRAAVLADETASAEVVHGFASAMVHASYHRGFPLSWGYPIFLGNFHMNINHIYIYVYIYVYSNIWVYDRS